MQNNTIFIYDFEVFKHDWIVVFKDLSSDFEFVIHNDIKFLKQVLSTCIGLIGFNNYNYDDLILYALINLNYTNIELYNLSQDIINKKNIAFRYKVGGIVTFDCKQELDPSVSLKNIEANLGLNIKESSIPWNIDRPLTKEELEETIKYCKHDVDTTKKVFKLREDYFQAKVDIAKEFKLKPILIKKTRAVLASEVLNANKNNLPKTAIKDRLSMTFIPKIRWGFLPIEIKKFYYDIISDFIKGTNYEELEKNTLNISLNDVEHTLGFGGIHGDKKAFKYKGDIIYFDVNSYYPSMMIEYKFLSRACKNSKDFKNLYDTRFKLKSLKDKKEYIYKILLNASYGATKDKYNKMFDPVQANNICVNGQILLADLIMSLKKYTIIIQSNTDGIILSYNPDDLDKILKLKSDWEEYYNLKLGVDFLKEIYQRDVNNYIMVKQDGTVKGKGRFKNWDENKINFEKYNLAIIDIALKKYYVDNIPIKTTIEHLIKEKILLPFQLVCKSGELYDYLVQYDVTTDTYKRLPQKVNRVFATKLKNKGPVFKFRNDKYEKFTNTPENTYIHNDDITKLNPEILDVDWYVNLCENSMIENQKIKNKIRVNKNQLSLFDLL